MAKAEMVKAVWTTNFDGLAAKAAAAACCDVLEATGKNALTAHCLLAPGKLLHVALHGIIGMSC
jgi:hypothetical protein